MELKACMSSDVTDCTLHHLPFGIHSYDGAPKYNGPTRRGMLIFLVTGFGLPNDLRVTQILLACISIHGFSLAFKAKGAATIASTVFRKVDLFIDLVFRNKRRGEYQSGYVHTGSGSPICVYRSAGGVRKAGAFNWRDSVGYLGEFNYFFHRPNIQKS